MTRAGWQDKAGPGARDMRDLFPPLSPYSAGYLDLEDAGGHSLYWEQSGNPAGVPVLLLHGGPGEGSSPLHRRFFDPAFYRIIIFDQRGAGKSQPFGSLENNTLAHLVEDIERLRERFRVRRWHLFAGSWGSALALAYAQAYPGRCASLILRSIFLYSRHEVDGFLYGARDAFPAAWRDFTRHVPPARHGDLLAYYTEALSTGTRQAQTDAALRWCAYEAACSGTPFAEASATQAQTQEQSQAQEQAQATPTAVSGDQRDYALTAARIATHYFSRALPGQMGVVGRPERLRPVPATIIHGEGDMLTPIETALALHKTWPEADFIAVPGAGHSALDPGLRSRLIEATENAKTIRPLTD